MKQETNVKFKKLTDDEESVLKKSTTLISDQIFSRDINLKMT